MNRMAVPPAPASALRGPAARVGLGTQAVLLLAQLRRQRRPEVVVLEELPDLEHGLVAGGVGAALGPLDRLFLRLDLPHPVASHELLGLRERSVHHRALGTQELHARAL